VLGVRRIERDAAGTTWIASSSGAPVALELHSGEERVFTPPPIEMTLDGGARPFRSAGLTVLEGSRGVALYRGGRRIELACTLLDASGHALAHIPLDYG
jgi:hypothetical protein